MTTTTGRVDIAAYNEVLDAIKTRAAKHPHEALFSFKGSELSSLSAANLSPSEARAAMRTAFQSYQADIEINRITYISYYFFEPSASDKDLFKLYVVIRRPGMLPAIIQGCAEKIAAEMCRYDVDEPVSISYPPVGLFGHLYPASTAETYRNWIYKEVAELLRSERVELTMLNGVTFDCRRT